MSNPFFKISPRTKIVLNFPFTIIRIRYLNEMQEMNDMINDSLCVLKIVNISDP